jgi:hypothetical protein
MSRPVFTGACARCDRTGVRFAATWPEGRVCRRCYQQATRLHGTCPGCGQQRLLPGLLDGAPACTDCAGIPKDFHCTRCGREDEPVRTGLCAHCCLSDDLTALFDDGNGAIAAPLLPLFTALTGQKHPHSARIWLTTNRHAEQLLRDLAQGRLPLSHETFQHHRSPTKVAFLRALCIEHQLLEPVNLDIERFQAWLETKVSGLPTDHARLIRQYARWVHLNRMRQLETAGGLRKGTFLAAKQSTTMAIGFLGHLKTRGHGPKECTQSDVDAWLTDGPTTRSMARGFVRWAVEHGHLPAVTFPYRTAQTTLVISQAQRLGHLGALTDPSAGTPPAVQVAALFLLLYGQPLTRITRMRLDQIHDTDGQLTVAFTDDRLAIPAPFETIVRAYLDALPNTNTAAHRQNTWLFPGTRPGQHIHQNTVMIRLRERGIDLLGARNASLRALVLEMPAPVVADALNYSYQVTDRHRRDAGSVFADYIATRSTSPLPRNASPSEN